MPISKATGKSVAPAAKGDLVVGSATNDAAVLAVGSANQVLTVDSSTTTGLKWATAAGGGKLLQVVTATTTAQVGNSTNTFADTGLTATITPTSATSTILVMIDINTRKNSGHSQSAVRLKLLRGATNIWETTGLHYSNTDIYNAARTAIMYKDSPATTSATTYKLQFCNAENAASVTVAFDGSAGFTHNIHLLEIGA